MKTPSIPVVVTVDDSQVDALTVKLNRLERQLKRIERRKRRIEAWKPEAGRRVS